MNRTLRTALCLIALSAFPYNSFAADTPAHQPDLPKEIACQPAAHETHWDYTGDGRPENWGELKPEFKTCSTGQFQSPVDLVETLHADLPEIKTDYRKAPLTLLNNGHTLQINYPEGSKITVDGVEYNLLQFHFHTPSEHTIAGESFPMELHFVHKTKDGKLAVLGVMIAAGEENETAAKIWDNFPETKSDAKELKDVTINPNELLPESRKYFRLSGSLTTPPCTEGVNWHVLAQPITFSQAQIDKFKSIFPFNARPVQPLGNRMLILDK